MPNKVERLTEKLVAAKEATGKQYSVRDDLERGMILLVSPQGAKSFYVYKRVEGRPERILLGRWPDLSVERARTKAASVKGAIADGDNQAKKKRTARADMTVGELWDRYLKLHAKPSKRSWRNDKLQFDKHLKKWRKLRLTEVDRHRVARLHASIAAKKRPAGGPIAANRVIALLSSMWGWGRDHLGVEAPNPCENVKRAPEKSRDRTLSESEMSSFIKALRELEDRDGRDALWLMLLTGQRKSCVVNMAWSELNLRDGVWTIPADRMKSGNTHRVPLPEEALKLLKARNRGKRKKAETVFQLPARDVRTPLRKVLKNAGLTHVTPHDLRRTCASWLGRHGKCDVAVVSALLGHSDKALGVLGTYRRPFDRRDSRGSR